MTKKLSRGLWLVRPARTQSRLNPRHKVGRVLEDKPQIGKVEMEWWNYHSMRDGERQYFNETMTNSFCALQDFIPFGNFESAERAALHQETLS
jgi:hypothetical protein